MNQSEKYMSSGETGTVKIDVRRTCDSSVVENIVIASSIYVGIFPFRVGNDDDVFKILILVGLYIILIGFLT